jgi:hypothetical protein
MSPRAAWRLETLGFEIVYDYTAGKAVRSKASGPAAPACSHRRPNLRPRGATARCLCRPPSNQLGHMLRRQRAASRARPPRPIRDLTQRGHDRRSSDGRRTEHRAAQPRARQGRRTDACAEADRPARHPLRRRPPWPASTRQRGTCTRAERTQPLRARSAKVAKPEPHLCWTRGCAMRPIVPLIDRSSSRPTSRGDAHKQ